MPRYKILYVITDLNIGGTEKQLAQLVLALDKDRFEPIVVGLKGWGYTADKLSEAGIAVYTPLTLPSPSREGGRGEGGLWNAWQLLRSVFAEHNPAIIHTWLFRANFLGRYLSKFF